MKFGEAHYCNLQSQSNVYGLTKITMPCGQHKLLVASLRGKVMSMEFQKTRPLSKDVPFTYIPGDAEIVSIDAFNKCYYGNGVVVGITFIKTTENKSQFLNIYSEWEQGAEFNLDIIAQGCQNLELGFVPYQLLHAELAQGVNVEMVFLLAGGDQKVHLYREDRYQHTFSEEPVEDFFPELSQLPGIITWMECKSYENYQKRLTAYGCQNGIVKIFIFDIEKKEVVKHWNVQHDSPITSLHAFTIDNDVPVPSFVNQVLYDEEDDGLETDIPDFYLLVASALESAVIYRSILTKGLDDVLMLADSCKYDSIICTCVADVDLDGENEILLGTYGQELLVYKYLSKTPSKPLHSNNQQLFQSSDEGTVSPAKGVQPVSPFPSTEELNIPVDLSPQSTRVSQTNLSGVTKKDGEFQLIWSRGLPDPILSIDHVDITGDGLKEIIVTSLKGLHILQHDLQEVADICIQRLTKATHRQAQEDVFTQLLQENLSEPQDTSS